MAKKPVTKMYRFSLYDKAGKSRGSVEAENMKDARKEITNELRNGTKIPEGWTVVNRGLVSDAPTKVVQKGIGLQGNITIRTVAEEQKIVVPEVSKEELAAKEAVKTVEKSVPEPSYMMTDDYIMLVHNGKPLNIHSTSCHYKPMRNAILNKQWATLLGEADVAYLVNAQSCFGIRMEGGVITYKGEVVHNVLADRIVKAATKGEVITPMIKFLENLMENPVKSAIEELYLFMEKNDLPMTDDGCFLAYKRVDNDYMDCHSHTVPNHIGNIVEMDRKAADTNRNNTCSHGLHFCSRSYLSSFSGARTVIVKIDPRDVVAIPNDYSNAKGRCCRYTVVDELINGRASEPQLPTKYKTGAVVGKHVFVEKPEYESFDRDSTKSEEDMHKTDVTNKLDTEGLDPKVAKFVDDIREVLEKDGAEIAPNIIRMVRIYLKLTPKEVYPSLGISDSAYRQRESVSNRPKAETINQTVALLMKLKPIKA